MQNDDTTIQSKIMPKLLKSDKKFFSWIDAVWHKIGFIVVVELAGDINIIGVEKKLKNN